MVAISLDDRWLDIKKRGDSAQLHPDAVFAHKVISTSVLTDSLKVCRGAPNGRRGPCGDQVASRVTDRKLWRKTSYCHARGRFICRNIASEIAKAQGGYVDRGLISHLHVLHVSHADQCLIIVMSFSQVNGESTLPPLPYSSLIQPRDGAILLSIRGRNANHLN